MKSELSPPEAGVHGVTKIMLGQHGDSSSLCGGEVKGSWAHTLAGRPRFSVNNDRNSLSQPRILCGPGEFSPDLCLGLSVVSVCLKKPWEERAGMTQAEKMRVVCLRVRRPVMALRTPWRGWTDRAAAPQHHQRPQQQTQ